MRKRSWSPTFDMSTVPDAVLKSEWGRRTQALRINVGRKRAAERCACGRHTAEYAANPRNRHVCMEERNATNTNR